MENEKKSLKVHIFGSEYTLKAEADNGEIFKIAEYVDTKMREIQAIKPSRPLHQIAILTALNITQELFAQKQRGSEEFDQFRQKIQDISKALELGVDNPSEVDGFKKE